jgi:hypothetical protein
MKPPVDPILLADQAEEEAAAERLRAAATADDLRKVWWAECESFQGAARDRLRDVFAEHLQRLGIVGGFN